MEVRCPQCKNERTVKRPMYRLIERGIYTGNCKSCSLKGNKYRLNEFYDSSLYGTRLYKIWSNMKTRCTNSNVKAYKNYGGRGIKVCPEWDTFAGFLDNLPKGYAEDLTLDRVDNNMGYSKENCRWSDPKTQSNNKRNNRLVTLDGQTKTLQQWIDQSGLKTSTVAMRLHYGWSEEEALLTNKQ